MTTEDERAEEISVAFSRIADAVEVMAGVDKVRPLGYTVEESRPESAIEAENITLRKAVAAVVSLIDQSAGVYGGALKDGGAEWGELLAGGSREEWLIDLSQAWPQ